MVVCGQLTIIFTSFTEIKLFLLFQDNDSCEEWERHEALNDDPSNQERNKERLFEEEIELKWEKGGSGLVFYTDAQYWQAQEGGGYIGRSLYLPTYSLTTTVQLIHLL